MTTRLSRRTRWSLLIAGGAVMTLLAGGCSGGLLGSDDSDSAESGPIVLGMLVPLSGGSAATGPDMKNGAQLAIDEINAKGGVNGRKLELKVEDDACDPKTAVTGANKLVTAQVVASVGGYCSGATLPTLPVFSKSGIPMVIPVANSDELVAQRLPNVFLINGTGTQQADAAFKFMTKIGAKSAALVDDNTSYSKNLTDLTASKLGGSSTTKLAGRESVTAGESDYSANVHEILSGKPDFVYWTGYYQEGGLLARQLRQAGYQGTIMVADGSVDEKFAEIAGKTTAEGVYATMTLTPETIPGAEGWIDTYQKKFNAAPGPYSTQCYDAVRVAAEAIGKAGSTKGEDITEALVAIDGLKLFSGPLKFTPDHTLSANGFQILEIKDGKFAFKESVQ